MLIAALHFLSPEFDPIQRPTSEYAVGPYGYLTTSAFIAMSVGVDALGRWSWASDETSRSLPDLGSASGCWGFLA